MDLPKLGVSCLLLFGVVRASLAQFEEFGRLDTSKEIEVGRQAFDYFKAHEPAATNQIDVRRVERVRAELKETMTRPPYPYQAFVCANDEVNAFCLPGGFIVVYEGLLSKLPDDNELAFVLGHEMGHATLRHWAKMMRKLQGAEITGVLLGALVNSSDLGSAYTALTAIHYQSTEEAQADAFGTELYLRAGFDPKKVTMAMEMFTVLEANEHHHVPPYLRDHPPSSERVKSIRAKADELLKAGGGSIAVPVAVPSLDLEDVAGTLPLAASAPNDYFPLEEGREWTYTAGVSGATSAYTVSIIEMISVKGTNVYRVDLHIDGSAPVSYQEIADTKTVWRRNEINDPKSQWQPEFAMPDGSPVTIGGWTFTAAGLENVSTPAGDFADCLKIHAVSQSKDLTLWFAKGVGLVQRISLAGVTEKLATFKIAHEAGP